MHHILNEEFFVFTSFTLCIILIFKPTKKILTGLLSRYSDNIFNSIAEAERIRIESEAELSKIKEKSAAINAEVEKILFDAKKEGQLIMAEARNKAEHILAKRSTMALQRIAQQEDALYRIIRDELVAHVLSAVEKSLSNGIDNKAKQALIADGIANAKKILH